MPVEEVALALGPLRLQVVHFANDLGADRAVRWEQLLDGAGCKVHAALGHNRMHHLGCAVEVGSAGCVLAQPGALHALFVLLVALLAGVFVLVQQVDVPHAQAVQLVAVHGLDHVGVKVGRLLRAGGVHAHHGGAVGHLHDVGHVLGQLNVRRSVFIQLGVVQVVVLVCHHLTFLV